MKVVGLYRNQTIGETEKQLPLHKKWFLPFGFSLLVSPFWFSLPFGSLESLVSGFELTLVTVALQCRTVCGDPTRSCELG